jgi:hypothetical protein
MDQNKIIYLQHIFSHAAAMVSVSGKEENMKKLIVKNPMSESVQCWVVEEIFWGGEI